jgi:hypothetical protein
MRQTDGNGFARFKSVFSSKQNIVNQDGVGLVLPVLGIHGVELSTDYVTSAEIVVSTEPSQLYL